MKIVVIAIGLIVSVMNVTAQSTITKGDLKYVITTGVPFIRITTDARSAGMGEVGVSTSADNNSAFHNPAKLAFIDGDAGAAINFAPWLSQITKDIYLANINGYYKLAPSHTVGLGIRYFTLGEIIYTNDQGINTGTYKPYEFAVEGNYAFRLARQFSIGASARYIYSNLSSGTQNGTEIAPGSAFSVDLSAYYRDKIEINGLEEARINIGANLSNMGTKIQYTAFGVPDYIPTNLAIGSTFEADFDEHSSLSGSLQFSKLLVPTPTYQLNTNTGEYDIFKDANNNGIPDFKEKSSIAGILSSFGDHEDGITGELSEFITQIGVEYGYNKTYFLRAGFFYEPTGAGGRQFATLGAGYKYNKLKIDFSYLLPVTQQKSPLDNQMRLSLGINFNEGNSKHSNPYY